MPDPALSETVPEIVPVWAAAGRRNTQVSTVTAIAVANPSLVISRIARPFGAEAATHAACVCRWRGSSRPLLGCVAPAVPPAGTHDSSSGSGAHGAGNS